jgi:outer membrane protein OmpA-like peptidoglycan-associated protein
MQQFKRGIVLAGLIAISVVLAGCASTSKKTTGTAVGVGVGGAIGAVIGNQTGSTARGAIIGAVVGGAAGMIVGARMDKQAADLRQEIPGATITRVGEGIVVTFASGLMYDFDSDRVRDEAAKNLRSLSESLDRFPDTDVLIVGHTDAAGTASYNEALSQRRASSASNYLISQGVKSTRLRASGRGEMEPIATNDTEIGRQQNRRVENAIYANSAGRASASK